MFRLALESIPPALSVEVRPVQTRKLVSLGLLSSTCGDEEKLEKLAWWEHQASNFQQYVGALLVLLRNHTELVLKANIFRRTFSQYTITSMSHLSPSLLIPHHIAQMPTRLQSMF